MTHIFEVENIKCGGCMNSIRKGLEQLPGVQAARPDNTTGIVEVDFEAGIVDEKAIADKLADMGYPIVGENTLGKKAKSYVSCMVGRMS